MNLEQEANSGSEGGDGEGPFDDPDILAQQENAAMEIVEHDADADCEEIMAYSDEEHMVAGMAESKFNRVKTFMYREAYQRLQARGATMLPSSCGAFLGYHATTRTWQGYYRQKSISLSFTRGGRTHRSETEALFRVIRGIVQQYCNDFPRDLMWKGQLNKLLDLEATITKL